MGFYEGAQEILAVADSVGPAPVRVIDCVDTRVRCCPFYLYLVLGMKVDW